MIHVNKARPLFDIDLIAEGGKEKEEDGRSGGKFKFRRKVAG